MFQGMVLHYLDNNKSAEKVLRDAVNADPTLNESWWVPYFPVLMLM